MFKAAIRLVVFISCALLSWMAVAKPVEVFTVLGPEGEGVLRWITSEASCPSVRWDNHKPVTMKLRTGAIEVPVRVTLQSDQKASVFDQITCEAKWPRGVKFAQVKGRKLNAPKYAYQRILIIADTGCRMKASENAFQSCNDLEKWPFAKVAKSASEKTPDLVIHIGDIHYRESPCPTANLGCKNSPWGYGADAWRADFFEPAKPLLDSAPWVFVRGNHESCARAGQGWYRFIEPRAWDSMRSCDNAELDSLADYSNPYVVPVDENRQFIIFDSSAAIGKKLDKSTLMFKNYSEELETVNNLPGKKDNFFLSHHPFFAIAPVKSGQPLVSGGNKALLSVLGEQENRLNQIDYFMHGHIHAFESLSFDGDHPSSFVLGNSGSQMEGELPKVLPENFEVSPNLMVKNFSSHPNYGFSILEFSKNPSSESHLTAYDVNGKEILLCVLTQRKSICQSR